MDFPGALIVILVVVFSISLPVRCASFQQIRGELVERTQQGLPPDSVVIQDVKDWVSETVNELTNQVEYLGNEIEKAVFRQTVLEHNQFLSDDGPHPNDLQRESPEYDVICASADGYETRQYRKGLWVITFGDPGEGYQESKLRCQSKIQRYILGENQRGVRIHITSPWLSQVFIEGDHVLYAFLFYIPSYYQADPPPPTDRTIFFTYMSPKVFAFSLSSDPVGPDAGLSHHRTAASLLNLSEEQFNDKQYFVADYEAPFSRASLNNEILIPMNDSSTPHCGLAVPTTKPPVETIPKATCPDCENEDHVQPIRSRLEVRESNRYIRKVINICSFASVDMVIMDLFLYCQDVLPTDVLNKVSGDILLRVSGRPLEGQDDCDAVSVGVHLKLPPMDGDLLPMWETNDNISVVALDSMLIYTTDVSESRMGDTSSFLNNALQAYEKLEADLTSKDVCFEDHDFYLSGNLKTSTAMTQVQIPYSSGCWTNSNRSQGGADDDVAYSTSEAGSGDYEVVIDTFV